MNDIENILPKMAITITSAPRRATDPLCFKMVHFYSVNINHEYILDWGPNLICSTFLGILAATRVRFHGILFFGSQDKFVI